MTIRGVGKPVPSQMFLMQLAGLVVAESSRVADPSEDQIAESKQLACERLKRMTGEDFGHDVLQWFNYLAAHSEKYGVTHPYGYGNMRRFLKQRGYELPYKKDIKT